MNNRIRIALALAAAAVIPACGGDHDPAGTTYVQVERLGRPAINEGLFVTNDFLNAVNSISPSQDGGALVGPVFAEAAATLGALANIGTAFAATPPAAGDVVTALIPDVMRIDTTIASPVGVGAYANGAVAVGTTVRPIAGRKLEDDVIDVTYQVLTGVAGLGDGVPYTRPAAGAGSTNPAIGHKLLNGQAAANGTATFPFLAAPN